MKLKRTFKLVYEWIKYPPHRKHFHYYNPSLRLAENVVTLDFNKSSATDKATILARCKTQLGYYANPVKIFEFDHKTNQYTFLQGETK